MKVVINFTSSEDEQEVYKELDMLARLATAGARVSLVAAGATEESITKIFNEVDYSAVSSDEGATIELGINLDRVVELVDDMDLDMDVLKTLSNLLHS